MLAIGGIHRTLPLPLEDIHRKLLPLPEAFFFFIYTASLWILEKKMLIQIEVRFEPSSPDLRPWLNERLVARWSYYEKILKFRG